MSKNIFIVAVLLFLHHATSVAQTFTCGDTLTDSRDGKKYATVLIGTECWFKDNLNYGTLVQSTESTVLHSEQTNNGIAEKYAQQNNANNLLIYGGLYEQAELMNYTNTTDQGLCPAGWHVSTDQDWQKLIMATGGVLVSPSGGHGGNALKKIGEGWGAGVGTDTLGIGLKHGGDRDGYGVFYGMGQRSIYWTSTPAGTQQAYHYTLWANNDTIQRLALGTSTTGFSCRCVKDQSTTGATEPWQSPLMMAWSNDGITFDTPMVFQDSSGVPSVIRWKGDTLAAVFQWFRQPIGSNSWDRVAVKFSYNEGQTWTTPTPIVVQGMPASYQRPFDPTLAVFAGGDSLRLYFSSSSAMPNGLDSTINTYSAKSTDGIHYTFEPNARVDVSNNRVIDPALIYFNNAWHYAAPIGSPQQGAYHYVSPNGLNFNVVPNIMSDNNHNWTGNYMVNSVTELRFYGCGSGIWYNSSSNGGVWNGYVPTNIQQGGDPSVVKIGNNSYLMIYVGLPCTTPITPIIVGNMVACTSNTHAYSVAPIAGSTYAWTVVGGVIISGQGTNQITVQWNNATVGTVSVAQTVP